MQQPLNYEPIDAAGIDSILLGRVFERLCMNVNGFRFTVHASASFNFLIFFDNPARGQPVLKI
jgi:hypothetical protein